MTIRQSRLPLLLVMEILWGWALAAVIAQAFSSGDGAGPSLLAVAAVVLASLALARTLQEFDLDETRMRVIGVTATIAVLFVILRLEYARTAPIWDMAWLRTVVTGSDNYTAVDAGVFGGSLVLIALWMRGVVRGAVPDMDEGAGATGILLGVIPVTIAAASQPSARGPEAFGALAVAYVALAVLVLAVSNAAEDDRRVSLLARGWAPGAAGVAAAAFGLAVVGAAIDPGSFGFLATVGEPLRASAIFVLTYIILPPFAAIAWLITSIIPDPSSRELEPQLQPQEEERRPMEEGDRALWASILLYILVGAFITVITLIVLALIALAFRRFARRKPRTGETHAAIERDRTLSDELGDLLAGLRGRFPHRQPSSAVAVRRLYAHMLDHAAALGLERPPSATPLQFAPALDQRYASDAPSAITEAFIRSRYAATDIETGEVHDLERRWREARHE
jgi:hypothetical protein